jgi:hypothetical protein
VEQASRLMQNYKYGVAETERIRFNSNVRENYLCNYKNNHRIAASAAVRDETGNFTYRTRNEARPHRACPKAFL